jgi:hypothetical protein
MSYAEYLRRKAAAAPVILNTQKPTDASMFTLKKRMEASSDFLTDGSSYGTTISGADRSGNDHRPTSFKKATGRPAAASDFTSYRGSQAIGSDAAYARGIITQVPVCASCLPTLGAAPKSASDFTRGVLAKQEACGEVHTASELGAPLFVDTTIRNIGKTICVDAIHTAPANTPRASWSARPAKSAQPFVSTPSPDEARKVGGALRSIPYVEKHHGNDGNVNPRRVPIKYQIPAGSPAHLKINEPTHYPVA